MTLRFHPAADQPVKAAAVAFLVGLIGSAVFTLVAQPLVAAVIMLAFANSLSAFFLPTTYEATPEHLVVRRPGSTRTYPWTRFRSFERDRNGIFLSPYRRRHRLDSLRGVFLPLKDKRALVRILLEHNLEPR